MRTDESDVMVITRQFDSRSGVARRLLLKASWSSHSEREEEGPAVARRPEKEVTLDYQRNTTPAS